MVESKSRGEISRIATAAGYEAVFERMIEVQGNRDLNKILGGVRSKVNNTSSLSGLAEWHGFFEDLFIAAETGRLNPELLEAAFYKVESRDKINYTLKPMHVLAEKSVELLMYCAQKYRTCVDDPRVRALHMKKMGIVERRAIEAVFQAVGETTKSHLPVLSPGVAMLQARKSCIRDNSLKTTASNLRSRCSGECRSRTARHWK